MTGPIDDGTNTDGGALRKQLEKALTDLKAQTEANEKLNMQLRNTSVKDLFAELKADPRGVKFYTGEPTKEALASWLGENGDGSIFATAPQAPASDVVVPGAPVGVPANTLPPGITPEMLAAAQAVAGLVPRTPDAPTGDLAALTDKLDGLRPDQAEYGSTLTDAWSAIRAQAAARIAAGVTL